MKKYLFTPRAGAGASRSFARDGAADHSISSSDASGVQRGAADSARERMKPLYGTASEVIILSASGTGAMEAAVINLLQPGEHAIFVNGGKFGERWGKLLAAFGVIGHEVRVEWGRAARPEQVEDAFKAYPQSRALLVQASETSTCAQCIRLRRLARSLVGATRC